jgi:hypothetical protein
LVALSHGGREVMPTVIYVRALESEVCWWSSPSPLLDGCAGSVSLRWRGWVACVAFWWCRGGIVGMHHVISPAAELRRRWGVCMLLLV